MKATLSRIEQRLDAIERADLKKPEAPEGKGKRDKKQAA